MPRAAPYAPRRNDIFIEAVADRHVLTYRMYHRPTGLVVATSFAQRDRRRPAFSKIIGGLFVDLVELLHEANFEEPFDAPAA